VPERKGRAAGDVEPRESGGHRRQPALERGYASEQGGERLGLGWTTPLRRACPSCQVVDGIGSLPRSTRSPSHVGYFSHSHRSGTMPPLSGYRGSTGVCTGPTQTALLARITHAAKPFPHGYAAVNGPGRIEPATLDGATFRADARIPKRGDTKRRRLGADSENENGHEHRRQGAQRGEVLAPRH
jgi:hypothetical protein